MAMSGGIDSTIASLVLHESGYEVIGITMKTWDYQNSGGSKKETGCCSLDSINDARKLAVDCGFPHIVLDMREEFGDAIIDNFVDEYIAPSHSATIPYILKNKCKKLHIIFKTLFVLYLPLKSDIVCFIPIKQKDLIISVALLILSSINS